LKIAPIEYHRPQTLEEALHLLARYEGEAKPLAGGQSLIPLLAMRMASPQAVVDLNDLPELGLKRFTDDEFIVGAMTRHRAIEADIRVAARCAAIAEVVPLIGHPAIRNRGTVGGSVAHADAAGEWPALCLLLDAVLELTSPRGNRSVPADQFFRGFLSTVIEPDELLVSVRLRMPGRGTGTAFKELTRRHGDYALVGVGVSLTTDDQELVVGARVTLTGVASVPHRASEAEGLLIGEPASSIDLEEVANAVATSINPPPDLNGDTEYRRQLSRVLTKRVLPIARARALALEAR
jgi:carbon-monoxide dehydrogenase medium subunit